ncbi:MAG: tyrosine-type recombinase/integrase, partial [Akkermansiaceae bacterium]|nr:tyrosine-type recombinase/integrase [Akkermansiaceae bacterium]
KFRVYKQTFFMLALRIINTQTTMNTISYNNQELAAIEVLRQTGVAILDAALVAKSAIEAGRGRVRRAIKCISAGVEELQRRERTVTFERAVEEALAARRDRRRRTVYDFRYICKRFMKRCKGLAKRRLRSITPQECTAYLHEAFNTPSQRNKARLILSGIFSTAVKRGWCAENPVRKVEPEKVVEKRIEPLTKKEIERVVSAAESYDDGSCLAATAIMLYAGVRPNETARLRWKDVHLDDACQAGDLSEGKERRMGVIYISPQHSKTGGARCVTIHPPLAKILREIQKAPDAPICPPNWPKHWAALHRKAGFTTWQPDVLRHTFATHHLAIFRNYTELQLEMGHRSADLLRTRYVAMEAAYRREESILLA